VSDADRAVEHVVRSTLASAPAGRRRARRGGRRERHRPAPLGGRPGRRDEELRRGVPVWATLIALQEDGVVTAGLVSAPALGRRWWASRGGGAHTGGALTAPGGCR
jgi:histidinol-phosphatase